MEVHKQIVDWVGDWESLFRQEFSKEYMDTLNAFLTKERKMHKIFPSKKQVFNAFSKCALSDCKVVILGQDPYHSHEQKNNQFIPHAHGLSFSIPKEASKIPPSLQNIYKELSSDLGVKPPHHGNLTAWAEQGVMLLNATLTVRSHEAGSHQGKGWEQFTDECIRYISKNKSHVVFMLWGKFAISKSPLIDKNKHLVLTSTHPSPFSAHKGFFGSKHFSKCNAYLKENGLAPIQW